MPNQLIRTIEDLIRNTNQVNRFLGRKFSESSTFEYKQDRFGVNNLDFLRGRVGGQVVGGVVVEVLPGNHSYKVHLDGYRQAVPCKALSQTGLDPLGGRFSSLYPPGTRVWVIYSDFHFHGTIIGVEPFNQPNPDLVLYDCVTSVSRCGAQIDAVHSALLNLFDANTWQNWSAGRPKDGLTGDYGVYFPTGIGLHLDRFMAFVRASPETGVWAFRDDDLLRLSGRQLQIRSAGAEENHYDDRGEFTAWKEVCLYPHWEGLGVLQPNQQKTITISDKESQVGSKSHYDINEPLFDDSRSFSRWHEIQGWLSDVIQNYLVAPPASGNAYRLSSTTPVPGLFREYVARNGRYRVDSVNGFSFRKRPAIVFPKEIKDFRDSVTAAPNYVTAGIGQTQTLTRTNSGVIRANGSENAAAFEEKTSSEAFRNRPDRFSYPESVYSSLPASGFSFETLSASQYLPDFPAQSIVLDHRSVTQVSLCSAGIEITPQGNLVLEGAFGESIKTVNGSIEMDCPGDIVLRPGRSLVVQAGRDLILRVRNAADLSVTEKSLRVRTGQSIFMEADEGILLSSQSTSDEKDYSDPGDKTVQHGISIKSNSGLDLYGSRVYARSTMGDLVLQAAEGDHDILIYANNHQRFITGDCLDHFGEYSQNGGWTSNSSNRFTANGSILNQNLGVNGNLAVNGIGVYRQNVISIDGSFANRNGGLIGQIEDMDSFENFVSRLTTEAQDETKQLGDDQFVQQIQNPLLEETRPGHQEFIESLLFSYRTVAEYGTETFIFYESRWQRIARQRGMAAANWIETSAFGGGARTMPYPGTEVLLARSFGQIQEDLLQENRNPKLSTDPAYSETSEPTPELVTLNSNYTVIS